MDYQNACKESAETLQVAHRELCCLHGDIYVERCTACGYEFERNYHVRRASKWHDHAVGTCTRCATCSFCADRNPQEDV